MRKFLVIAAFGLLAACANQQYAGVNYGEVMDPNGEHWIIAGGKDETNVKFEVKRPDGTVATYSAENADASTVIKQMATLVEAQTQALSGALAALLARVPAP
jgi:hypothetical protein